VKPLDDLEFFSVTLASSNESMCVPLRWVSSLRCTPFFYDQPRISNSLIAVYLSVVVHAPASRLQQLHKFAAGLGNSKY
jgi:hypothetical protein